MTAAQPGFLLRDATEDDIEFLQRAGTNAINWNEDREYVSLEALLQDAIIRRYLDGWLRSGDIGVIATDDRGNTFGACWMRFFTEAEPGYGFVSPDIPEISIGVDKDWRGRGVGRALLRALFDRARDAGIEKLSLAVERDNFAAHLYRSEGFVEIGPSDGDLVMVKVL